MSHLAQSHTKSQFDHATFISEVSFTIEVAVLPLEAIEAIGEPSALTALYTTVKPNDFYCVSFDSDFPTPVTYALLDEVS